MKSLSQSLFIGNLVADPETKFTATGDPICKFRIAVSGYKDEVEFINVVCFKNLAEIAGQYLSKGKPVFIQGRYKTETWDKDGVKQYKVVIVAENIQFLGKKEEGEKPEIIEASKVNEDTYGDIPF